MNQTPELITANELAKHFDINVKTVNKELQNKGSPRPTREELMKNGRWQRYFAKQAAIDHFTEFKQNRYFQRKKK